MLGFNDVGIGLIFLLTIGSGLLCLFYAIFNWNKGADTELTEKDKQWALEEKVIEKELE